MRTVPSVSLIFCALGCAIAQSTPGLPAFDVASVKPSPPIPTGPNRSMFVGMRTDPGRVTFSNVPVKNLIRTAYGFDTNARIDGGPGWLDSEMYDVVGTFPADTPSDRMPLMLRTLLAERCKLAVHHETRDQAVYAFVVARDGAKLKSHDPTNPGSGNRSARGHLELHNITLTQLGNFLNRELGRVVVDATGLNGTYDIVLDWTPADTPIDDPKANGPALSTAVQEQLGLRLEPKRAPIDHLVIGEILGQGFPEHIGQEEFPEGRQKVIAPMPGKVIRILVRVGDSVTVGQGLVVVEAMKMQNEIRSPKSGAVERLSVIEGQTVNAGEAIAVIA